MTGRNQHLVDKINMLKNILKAVKAWVSEVWLFLSPYCCATLHKLKL